MPSRITLGLLLCTLGQNVWADWPQFRGPNSSGIGVGDAPVEFGPGKNELWSVRVGSGHSSPCIVGDAIFITTFDADRKQLYVVRRSRKDGELVWRQPVPTKQVERGHPSFNPASSSPCSDGTRVVAYFGSFGLICFDMQGKKLWDIPMPLTKSFAGNATSPIIVGDRVILYRGNHVDHFVLAVNKRTGKTAWKVPQEEPFSSELACTACPIVWKDKLVLHTARSVQAVELTTGKQVWMTNCATTATSTPVLAGEEVIVAAWNKMGEPALRPRFPSYVELLTKHDRNGNKQIERSEFPKLMIFHRPEGAEAPLNGAQLRFVYADKNRDGKLTLEEWKRQLSQMAKFREQYKTHGVLAIPLESHGRLEKTDVRTLETQGIPEVPSPLHYKGKLYFVKNGGLLTCLDAKTGKRLSRTRTKGRGTHYASPIMSNGKIYCSAGNGVISVLRASGQPQLIAVNELGDNTYATPAIVDGTLFVRTHRRLHAFRNAAAK